MSLPWKLLHGSVVGTSHTYRGESCQDYSHGQCLCLAGSSVLIVACADGAGSASHAAIGAKLSCIAFVRSAANAFESGLTMAEVSNSHLLCFFDQARRRLSLEACLGNFELRDFACTLLAGILTDDGAAFSQIGDGAIVIPENEALVPVFWPQNGEYANTTFFLTESGYEQQIEFRKIERRIDELAMFTDGLQPLALHYATRSVHAPFFDPMFQALRNVSDVPELYVPLRDFLNSKAVNDRTDDDKTLLLATRRLATNERH